MILPELLKALLYGLVEGITEWLPVSSTGHLILLGALCPLQVSEGFSETFDVVIQLGAILAVVVLYAGKLNPLAPTKSPYARRCTWRLWGRVCVAVLPSAVVGFFLDDLLDEYLFRPVTVAVTLILYGILFILIERLRPSSKVRVGDTGDVTAGTALGFGLFQVLSLIPGTSRSGATILGGMLLGLSRTAAAEFSFFLGIPTMFGAGALKAVKLISSGATLTSHEVLILVTATLTAFLVSLATIRFLLDFVRRHSFAAFGVYRMLLGATVLLIYFL